MVDLGYLTVGGEVFANSGANIVSGDLVVSVGDIAVTAGDLTLDAG